MSKPRELKKANFLLSLNESKEAEDVCLVRRHKIVKYNAGRKRKLVFHSVVIMSYRLVKHGEEAWI